MHGWCHALLSDISQLRCDGIRSTWREAPACRSCRRCSCCGARSHTEGLDATAHGNLRGQVNEPA